MKKLILVAVMVAFMAPAAFADKKGVGPDKAVDCASITQSINDKKALVGQAQEEQGKKKAVKAD